MSMTYRTHHPDILRELIVRTQSQLRRLKAELRLAEAERRDRERLGLERSTERQEQTRG